MARSKAVEDALVFLDAEIAHFTEAAQSCRMLMDNGHNPELSAKLARYLSYAQELKDLRTQVAAIE